MHFDPGHGVHAQDPIAIEVTLFDFAVSKRDGTVQGCPQAEADAAISPGAIRIAVPGEILLPLKEATKVSFEIGTAKDAPKATFNLRSSKLVIEAIAPRCSQIDMSAFQAVTRSACLVGAGKVKWPRASLNAAGHWPW